jgi:hypothetical protein
VLVQEERGNNSMADSFLVYTEDGKELRVTVILAELRLEDRMALNMIDEDTFKNAVTGEILRRKR